MNPPFGFRGAKIMSSFDSAKFFCEICYFLLRTHKISSILLAIDIKKTIELFSID